MSETVAGSIHDAIDEVTTTVEEIHRSIADAPLDLLAGLTPFTATIAEVRTVQAQSIGAVYDLIREVNDRVRRLTASGSTG
jgi:hypothetical protein